MNKQLSVTMIRIMGLFCVLVVVGMMTGCSKPEGDKEYQYKFPAWTPDGKIVAVRRTIVTYPDGGGFGGGGYGGYEEYHLVKFNDDGSGEQTIKEVGYDAGYISVSTSSNYIGYAVNNYIKVIDWSGNQVDSIPTGVDGDAQHFDWSPDERKVVYYDNNVITVENLDSSTKNVIAGLSTYPSWKYSNQIVFRNTPERYLAISDEAGNIITKNITLSGRYDIQFLPNDPNKVVYFDNENNIYYYNLNTEQISVIDIGLANAHRIITIKFDGQKIVYDVDDKHILVTNIDGTNKRQIK